MELDNGAHPTTGGISGRESMGGRLRINTVVGATWTVPEKPSPKKRAARRKSPAPPFPPQPPAPWYVRNWSAGVALGAAAFSLGSFLHAAGWLIAPAKQSDVITLADKVSQMERRGLEADARIAQNLGDVAVEVKEHRSVLGRLESMLYRVEGKLDGSARKLSSPQ